jgi:hypothetical protein
MTFYEPRPPIEADLEVPPRDAVQLEHEIAVVVTTHDVQAPLERDLMPRPAVLDRQLNAGLVHENSNPDLLTRATKDGSACPDKNAGSCHRSTSRGLRR